MQLTKKQLKQLISEEVEKVSNENDRYTTLIEGYASDYGATDEAVPKEALMDLLEVMEESTIPREAFEAFMENLNEEKMSSLLSEVVDLEDKQ